MSSPLMPPDMEQLMLAAQMAQGGGGGGPGPQMPLDPAMMQPSLQAPPAGIPVDALVPPNPMEPTQQALNFDVSPQMVQQYMLRGMEDPKQAALAAAVDKIWADVGKQFKILTGEPGHDNALWMQHWDMEQGRGDRDPLHSNPDALEEFKQRVLEIAQKVVE